jgi:hypothetical protein
MNLRMFQSLRGQCSKYLNNVYALYTSYSNHIVMKVLFLDELVSKTQKTELTMGTFSGVPRFAESFGGVCHTVSVYRFV